MLWKFLIALAVAYCGWWLWRMPMLPSRRPQRAAPALGTVEPADVSAARATLGLDAGADEAAIRAAHRRLVAAVHPDRGGSAELTRRVNSARDILLKQITR